MVTRLWIISLVLGAVIVSGCGKEEQKPAVTPPLQTPPTQPTTPTTKWSAEELNRGKQSCTYTFVNDYGYESKSATLFCSCIYDVIGSRWTVQEWQKSYNAFIQQLVQDKSIDKCVSSSNLSEGYGFAKHLSRGVR